MLAVQNCLTYYPGSLPLASSPDPTHERKVSGDTWLIPQASLKIHSLLCAWLTTKNKVLYRHAEFAKDFPCCTTDYVFCNQIGRENFSPESNQC